MSIHETRSDAVKFTLSIALALSGAAIYYVLSEATLYSRDGLEVLAAEVILALSVIFGVIRLYCGEVERRGQLDLRGALTAIHTVLLIGGGVLLFLAISNNFFRPRYKVATADQAVAIAIGSIGTTKTIIGATVEAIRSLDPHSENATWHVRVDFKRPTIRIG